MAVLPSGQSEVTNGGVVRFPGVPGLCTRSERDSVFWSGSRPSLFGGHGLDWRTMATQQLTPAEICGYTNIPTFSHWISYGSGIELDLNIR